MEYRQAEFIANKQGMIVRPQKLKDRRPAITRFLEMTERVKNGDDYCLVWRGGDTFRVDDDTVTTPARFIYQEITGETLPPRWRLVQTCKTPNCVKSSHREPRKACGLIR